MKSVSEKQNKRATPARWRCPMLLSQLHCHRLARVAIVGAANKALQLARAVQDPYGLFTQAIEMIPGQTCFSKRPACDYMNSHELRNGLASRHHFRG